MIKLLAHLYALLFSFISGLLRALLLGACAFAIVYGGLTGLFTVLENVGVVIPKVHIPVCSDQSGDFCPANMRAIESILGTTPQTETQGEE